MLTLCDVATFALQFLVTEDVRELSAACKDIFAGPPCMSRSCHARAWRLRAPHTLASLYQLVGRLHLEKPNLHHLGSTLGHFADVLELDISFPPPLVGITSPPPPLDLRALLPRLRVLRVRERAARHCLPLFDSIAALPPSLRFVDLQHVHARDRALGALWRPLREHPARLLLLLCACRRMMTGRNTTTGAVPAVTASGDTCAARYSAIARSPNAVACSSVSEGDLFSPACEIWRSSARACMPAERPSAGEA